LRALLLQAESLAGVQEGAEIKSKVLAVIKVPLAATSMKVVVRTILDDYFASGDLHSAVAALAELEGKRPGQEAVKRCLVLALEMKDSVTPYTPIYMLPLMRTFTCAHTNTHTYTCAYIHTQIRTQRGLRDVGAGVKVLDALSVCSYTYRCIECVQLHIQMH